MEAMRSELIQLVDQAIRAAERELKNLSNMDSSLVPLESAALTIKNLKVLKENLLKGTIKNTQGSTFV